MKTYKNILYTLLLIVFCFFFSSLKNEKFNKDIESGKIVIHFVLLMNGQPVQFDTLIYKNIAGNRFEINQVQYFISEVTIHKASGEKILLSPDRNWHYVDKDIPKTLTWYLTDKIEAGVYDSISFTFGLSKNNNKSFKFRNPPENLMAWPDVLGGGYHYMKINLKYLNHNGELSNFNCHLGTGQVRNNKGNITSFIQNSFCITLPNSSFVQNNSETKEVQLIMNLENWFNGANKIDFNNYGGIMDKQEVMKSFCENGAHVFSVAGTSGIVKDSWSQPKPYLINIPLFPDSLNIPADNPMTNEGVELGRYLFYDGRMSGHTNKKKLMSCASCHRQEHAFECGINHPLYKDGHPHGLSGKPTPHTMLPLINLVWVNEGYMWNGSINKNNNKLGSDAYGVPAELPYHYKNIESFVWMSIVAPHEMNGSIKKTVRAIQKIPMYSSMFKRAFGSDSVTIDRISKAIAQFVRSLVSFNSKFDRFMDGKAVLSNSEKNGLYIFSTERGDCFHCHGSPAIPLWTTNLFMNNAKDINFNEPGDRYSVTGNPKDRGKYRVPTLRNIEFTAPYMHDGRFKTLDEVLDFYNSGLKRSPYVDPLMINMNHGGIHLPQKDIDDLKAFLKTLSDSSFITNPAFSNPRPEDPFFIK